jgi:hypothetical protein
MTKIPLKEIIAAIDLNSKSLWDELDDDQRKALKSELWILNRYASCVKTNSRNQAEHYVLAVNELYNKNWFELSKHPKLQWYLLCMCNWDGEKVFYHEWMGLNGKKKGLGKKIKILEDRYPHLKQDELELLAEINTDEQIKSLARELGWEEKELKDL